MKEMLEESGAVFVLLSDCPGLLSFRTLLLASLGAYKAIETFSPRLITQMLYHAGWMIAAMIIAMSIKYSTRRQDLMQ